MESRLGGEELASLLRYYTIPDLLDRLSLVPRCCQYRPTSRLWQLTRQGSKRVYTRLSVQAGLIGAAHLILEVERKDAAEFLMKY